MFPGYKHVDEFGPDDNYEDGEEVCYVTLDLGHDVDKALLQNSTEYRLAGLDTETPMLQLHGSFFMGRHEELIGTELLFAEGRDETDPSRRFVVPFDMTEQRIQFKQVDVKPKTEPLNDVDQSSHVKASSSKAKGNKSSSSKTRSRTKSSKAKGKEPERNIVDEEEDMMDMDDTAF